jgi:hypothetical protein
LLSSSTVRSSPKLALALFTATLAAAPGCDQKLCTTIACPGGALLRADVPASWDRLQRSTITTCHNDTCVTGRFSAITTMPVDNGDQGFRLGPAPDGGWGPVSVSVAARPGGTFSIAVDWDLGTAVKDGDSYRVDVTDAGGTSLVSMNEKVAAYEVTQPNGPGCGTCRFVTIDRRAR